jgi:hypothetical protein
MRANIAHWSRRLPPIVLNFCLPPRSRFGGSALLGSPTMDSYFFRPRPFSSEEKTAERADDRFANGLPGVAQPGKIGLAGGGNKAFRVTARDPSSSRQRLGATAGGPARIAPPDWLTNNRPKQPPRRTRGHKSSHGEAASLARPA